MLDQFAIEFTLLSSAFLTVLTYLIPRIQRAREWMVVSLTGLSTAIILFVLFYKTPFGLNAYFGDQHYVIAAVTKFKYYSSFVDFNYANMSSYYPPLYFYILGKTSNLLHMTGYTAVKFGFIVTALVLPLLTFAFWKPIIGRRAALLVTMLVQFGMFDVFKTYEFVAVSLLLPWWIYFGERFQKTSVLRWGIGSIIGGILFQTYYYCFFIVGLYLLVKVVWNLFDKDRDLWSSLRHQILLLLGTAIFSADYWLPVVIQSFTMGYQNFQNQWVSTSMMAIELFKELETPTVFSVILLIGFVYFVLYFREGRLQRTLFQLVVACYVWYLIGFVGMELHAFNLFVKAWALNDYLLIVGFSLWLCKWLDAEKIKPFATRLYVVTLLVVTLVVGDTFFQNLMATSKYQTSVSTFAPPTAVNELKAVNNVKGKVFFTDQDNVVAFAPVFSFIGENINYANPAARYVDRSRFIKLLSRVQNPEALAWLYEYNQFDKVDYLWFESNFVPISYTVYPYQTRYENVPVSQVYKTSPQFTRVGDTDIYRVNPVARSAYRSFDVYELEVAYTYCEKSLRPDIASVLKQKLGIPDDETLQRTVNNNLNLGR